MATPVFKNRICLRVSGTAASQVSAPKNIAIGIVAMVLSLPMGLLGCAGSRAPEPENGYRANVTVRMTDENGGGLAIERLVEFYSMGKRRRHARIEGEAIDLIDRPDLHVSWLLDPTHKTFDEFRISNPAAAIRTAPNPFGPRVDVSFVWRGTEQLDGHEVERYEVLGETMNGEAWLTVDAIPLRFSGSIVRGKSSSNLEIEYTEIEPGSQAAFLFAIPPNYAGYAQRKQKTAQYQGELDDALRRLNDEVRDLPDLPDQF